jgi:hypothetical protein
MEAVSTSEMSGSIPEATLLLEYYFLSQKSELVWSGTELYFYYFL